ncbi:MAG TPA: hypothetical protein VHG28_02355, partial [Longimicrobiaceae bacterium]|nr:hypothetical protein [Longimicrobiaceae bacterium]
NGRSPNEFPSGNSESRIREGETAHPELLACLALAVVWAYHVSEWVHRVVEPVKEKKHGRRAKSLLRLGLDQLHEILLYRHERASALQICLNLLRCPGVLSYT